jgi:hypothetical protein
MHASFEMAYAIKMAYLSDTFLSLTKKAKEVMECAHANIVIERMKPEVSCC